MNEVRFLPAALILMAVSSGFAIRWECPDWWKEERADVAILKIYNSHFQYENVCYRISGYLPSHSKLSWDEAKNKCKEHQSGQLAKVINHDVHMEITVSLENVLVRSLFGSASEEYNGYYWIGLTKNKPTGDWVWSDGTVVVHDEWESGMDSFISWLTLANCAAMFSFSGQFSTGDWKWRRTPCGRQHAYLCQYDALAVWKDTTTNFPDETSTITETHDVANLQPATSEYTTQKMQITSGKQQTETSDVGKHVAMATERNKQISRRRNEPQERLQNVFQIFADMEGRYFTEEPIKQITTQTTLGCARYFRMYPECQIFNYNKEKHICRLYAMADGEFPATIEKHGWTVWRRMAVSIRVFD